MSHRTRRAEPVGVLPPATYGIQSQTIKASRLPTDKSSTSSHRLSMASNSSGGRRSSASLEGPSARPSAIPRPARPGNSTRSDAPTYLRPTATSTSRSKTPVHTNSIAPRTVLQTRTMPGTMPRMALLNSTPRIINDDDLMALESDRSPVDMDQDTALTLMMTQKPFQPSTNLPPRLIPELQALAAATQRRPTPAMSISSTISSPSTQFTTSPSPWSASTTATTPTSWSSASPALIQPTHAQSIAKRSQTVPVTSLPRTKLPKLPVLKESTGSSASSSKVNIPHEEVHTPKKTKKKTPKTSPAPTPPPRKSSIKRSVSDSNSRSDDMSLYNTDQIPPIPREQDISPVLRHVEESRVRQVKPVQVEIWSNQHNKLQEVINSQLADTPHSATQVTSAQTSAGSSPAVDQSKGLLDSVVLEEPRRSESKSSLQRTTSAEQDVPAARASSRSRLAKLTAFFGKSSKSVPTGSESADRPRKLQRRGPTAGTGHEGYRRPGKKERRLSNDGHTTGNESEASVASTRTKLSRSISREDRSSSKRRDRSSQSDLDEFAATRLNPVVIRGGSQSAHDSRFFENNGMTNTETQSSFTEVTHRNEEAGESADYTNQSQYPRVTSSGPLLRESRLMFHLDSLDEHDQSQLATRRSQKTSLNNSQRGLHPTNTAPVTHNPYPASYNSSQSSIAPTSASLTETSGNLYKNGISNHEKQPKRSRKLNWGFFKRKDTVPETYQPRSSSHTTAPSMPVRVSMVPPVRSMPYYAVLESENELSNADAISDFLNEAARTISEEDNEGYVSPILAPAINPLERKESLLLPTAPRRTRQPEAVRDSGISGEIRLSQPVLRLRPHPTPTMKQRQPRLAQVGRIPKVVNTTQAVDQIQPIEAETEQMPVRTPVLQARSTGPPILTINTNIKTAQLPQMAEPKVGSNGQMPLGLDHVPAPSRIYSQMPDRYSTTSSSSDGVISVMGPPLLPASIFQRRSLRNATNEEDVWNEYDDFIDHVISPPRLKKSNTRISDGDRIQFPPSYGHEKYTTMQLPPRRAAKGLTIDTSLAPPPLLFSSPISIGETDMDQDFQLRRSRIISALHSSLDPSSPFSIGDYYTEMADPSRDSARTSSRYSDSIVGQNGLRSPRTLFAFPEPPSIQPELKQYENAVHMDELERSKDPARHSERLYTSLMVSRWLSFGRVLFSPAHTDLQKQPERQVLVIDGLGSEDWSIYCAVTYQSEQAYIYDLKETGQTHIHGSTTIPSNTPHNFRRRQLASFNETFKFPDNFFSVIVLRFPPLMAESKMRNMISECRRVLAPGGYMELMLLDLDIVNMGVQTRRAMRELKTKMAMYNREVSLKPVIDNIQSALGEKGFSKLSKCVVGVPVIGRPAGDTGSPSSSRSSGTSDRFRKSPSAGPRPFGGLQVQRDHNASLNDLIADHSDNADAKIGRMVSRTARSWWQHCFEAAVIADGDLANSIFADRQVLSECKARASSFKLLIAYTQKPGATPMSTKRRTMSEPMISTLALATARAK